MTIIVSKPCSSVQVHLAVKTSDEYKDCKTLPAALLAQQGTVGPIKPPGVGPVQQGAVDPEKLGALVPFQQGPTGPPSSLASGKLSKALQLHKTIRTVKPTYHPPWKLVRVISGHLGWVRSVAVEPGNKWFVTGAGDRVIKVWDLASGELKLSLTGHISTVRGLAVSPRHPYLFSCGEDKVRRGTISLGRIR
jgi:pleiotropic regulator 1